ncbi:MAG: RES family NAD+ phosphorylase [Bacteroidales bacterium]|nr:RES family NAD+ phosphorylase [Bacteroidales bacterium]
MTVYRIVFHEFAGSLEASGRPARWNSTGYKMIYSAGSVSLACLENVVHRSSEGLSGLFKILVIEIPDDLSFDEIRISDLPENWTDFTNVNVTKFLGDKWLKNKTAVAMKVPSAIVPQESNYLINPEHPDFSKLRIIETRDFNFDKRIK